MSLLTVVQGHSARVPVLVEDSKCFAGGGDEAVVIQDRSEFP